MPTARISLSVAALSAFICLAPGAAQAQDQRFRISFGPSLATVRGDAELALGGSFGYRFSERFWFEGDLTWIDAAAGGFRERRFDRLANVPEFVRPMARAGLPGLPNLPGPIDIGRMRATSNGSTLVAMLGVRYELPVQTDRFRPYFAGGLGMNHTDQELRLAATAITPAIEESVSHTGYAFNAGAGASVRLAGQLWADVDARYLRLSRDRDIMRLGGGVSFRF